MTHAVVIGGGVAGLLAAHAWAALGRPVTLVERHAAPEAAPPQGAPGLVRRGVPQARCLHLLTAAGMADVDALVPGWQEAARAAGAVPFDAGADVHLSLGDGALPRVPTGLRLLGCSRALLESVLRTRLLARPGVRWLDGCAVSHVVCSAAKVAAVQGVALADGRELAAPTVIDTSGGGGSPPWLRALGPQVSVPVRAHRLGLRYVASWWRLATAPGWACLSIAPSARSAGRSAMLLQAEQGLWGLVQLQPEGLPLPTTAETIRQQARALPDPALAQALERAECVAGPYRLGSTDSHWRQAEQAERAGRWPEGLTAMGDAVCRLDPYHGLGMTLAARAARLLAQAGHGYQQRLAEALAPLWLQATGQHPDGSPEPAQADAWESLLNGATRSAEGTRMLIDVMQRVEALPMAVDPHALVRPPSIPSTISP